MNKDFNANAFNDISFSIFCHITSSFQDSVGYSAVIFTWKSIHFPSVAQ